MVDGWSSGAVSGIFRSIGRPEDGWKVLFAMVIFQALRDVIRPVSLGKKEGPKELQAEALDFLRNGGLDFAYHCAGWNPEFVRRRCEELIQEGEPS